MKKRVLSVILAVFVVALLCSCKKENSDTGKAKDVNVDTATCAEALLNGGEFKDNLAQIDSDMALTRLYNLDSQEIEASAFYTNSNATAEEIAVIKVNSEDYVSTVKAAFETRVTEQKEACKDYLPDEMTKLGDAVVYTNGKYAILCISCNSDKINDLIAEQFK